MDNERHAMDGRPVGGRVLVVDDADLLGAFGLSLCAAIGVDVASALPKPKPKREFTKFDQQRIAAAEVKRQKKNAKRLKNGG